MRNAGLANTSDVLVLLLALAILFQTPPAQGQAFEAPSVVQMNSVKAPQVIDLSKGPAPKKISVNSQALRKQPASFSQFIKNYSVDEGLPSPLVSSGAVDRFGNLWFGTGGGGVVRFDGKSFTVYDVDQGLFGRTVYSVHVDRFGSIWIGTLNGVSRFDGETFVNYGPKDGLAGNVVNSILEDDKGSFWFATNTGVSRFDGRTFSNFTTNEGLVDNLVRTILVDHEGHLWFGTNGGVSRFNGTSFKTYTEANGLADNRVFASLTDSHGDLWFGTAGGISKYDGKKFTNWTEKDEAAFKTHVTSILEDERGHLWFGTFAGGVLEFDGKSFTRMTKKQGLSNDTVKALLRDKSGKIWIAGNNGIHRYDGKSFTNMTTAHGLNNAWIRAVLIDKSRNIWMGTDGGGVVKYDRQFITTFTDEQGLGGKSIRACYEDKAGNLWFGHENGLTKFDGQIFTNYSTEQGMPKVGITSIVEDTLGRLWLSSYLDPGFLGKLDGSILTVYSKEQGLPGLRVVKILEDSKGKMWFATDGGASAFDGKSFTNYTSRQGLQSSEILSILEDKNGNFWFATQTALSRYDGHTFQHYYLSEGLSKGGIANLQITAQETMAVLNLHGLLLLKGYAHRETGSSLMCKGVRKIDVPVQNDMSNEELKKYVPVFENYTPEAGYPTGIPALGQNEMAIDRDGTMWLATVWDKTGLVHFDPAELYKGDPRPPELALRSVKINSKSINWHALKQQPSSATLTEEYTTFGKNRSQTEKDAEKEEFADIQFDQISKWHPIPQNLVLPYSHNNISFEVVAIELSRPQDVLYQYKLEGYDKDWSQFTNQSFATYGNINEGSYEFKVRARSPLGLCSEPVVYAFTVFPPWYRTWWAYTIYGLAILAFLFLIYRWRTAVLRSRHRALEILYRSAERFLPKEFLRYLKKEHFQDVNLGDSAEVDVAVMFSDIRGFTNLTEKLGPERTALVLNKYLGYMAPIIRQHDGVVGQFLGDGILAYFETNPEFAVDAVLEMQKVLPAFNKDLQEFGVGPVDIGVGLNVGHAMFSIIGEAERLEGHVISDDVNLAARVESLNKFYKTSFLITGAVHDQITNVDKYLIRLIDKVIVAGKTQGVRIYEVREVPNEADALRSAREYFTDFANAFAAYGKGDFDNARAMFTSCLRKQPEDTVAKVLLGRCEEFLKTGVPKTWDGTFRMIEK